MFSSSKDHLRILFLSSLVLMLSACGDAKGPDGIRGAAIGSRPQSIQFATAPALSLGQQVSVSAVASSGLPVSYASQSASVCTVEANTGTVTAHAPGSCRIRASQRGDGTWAPGHAVQDIAVQQVAQQLVFDPAPSLRVGDIALVRAVSSAGLAVQYASLTPDVCRVEPDKGRVTALAAGGCTIEATQGGDADHPAAQPLGLRIEVAAAGVLQVPGAPTGVVARAGEQTGSVEVDAAGVNAGGGAITRFTVSSVPAGIEAQGDRLPVSVDCAGECSGHAFVLSAHNAAGAGAASESVDLVTAYDVVLRFREPDYAHDMTEFHGWFRYNATRRTVTDLQGELSEVMAGDNQPGQPYPDGMPLLPLRHQLSSIQAPGGGGLLVTSFLLPHTNTLSADPRDGGTDGWSPGTGGWKYWGYDGGSRSAPNPGNAYVRIFVNTQEPTRALTQAQIDLLAYADCAPEGMMGDDCMTGSTRAGYGTIGSMRGYPVEQIVTRRR